MGARALLGLFGLLGAGCEPVLPQADADTGGDSTPPSVGDTDEPVDTGPPAPCGFTSTAPPGDLVEGDLVTFTVGCSLSALDAVELSVLGLPPSAESDPGTGVFEWQTNGADAGPVDLTFSARRRTGHPRPSWCPSTSTTTRTRPETAPLTRVLRTEFGLPVVHIDARGSLSESYVEADITLDGETVTGSAKVRGASSTAYPKKSYTLDFGGDELGVADWGERTRGHLYLLSTFDDNSYVRQKLVFDTWAAMAEAQGAQRLTPRSFFTVVYLNGDYLGLYLGVDRMDDEYIRHMGFSGEGDLYKSINHDANYRRVDARGREKGDLATGWEKKEGADESDFDPLRALMAFASAANPATLAAEGGAWVDLQEFMDWQILVTWTQSEDSAGKNAYLYRDDETGLFRFSPWDFNASYGQNWYTLRHPATYIHDFSYRKYIFEMTRAEPTAAEMRARFAALSAPGGPLTAEWQLGPSTPTPT